MASPFSVFRKHQKWLLPGAMLLAMIAFVFGDFLIGKVSNVGGQNPVVVEWKLGPPLRMSDLHNTQMLFNGFNDFVRHIQMEMGGMPARPEATTETQAVHYLLLSRRAEQMGMVVSDQLIKDMLRAQLTLQDGKPLPTSILYRAMSAARLTEYQLFAALRMRFLAGNLTQQFSSGLTVDPPAQRWDYYSRFERKVIAQLVPVAAKDLVAGIADPDAATVDRFFAAHKDKYPPVPYDNYAQSVAMGQPVSEEFAKPGQPGFKFHYRAALQYVKLPKSAFVEEAEKEVTDKEIQDYYEKEKDKKFLATELPPADASGDKKGAENETPPTETKPDATKQNETKQNMPMADEKAPAETKAPQSPATPGTSPATTAAQQTADPPQDAPKDAGPGASKPKYEPLEKVKDTIRKAIADEKATNKMEEALVRLKTSLDEYTGAYEDWQARLLDDKNAPQPQPPDLAELAKKEHAVAGDTGLVSGFDLMAQEFGKSFTIVQAPTGIPGLTRPMQRSVIELIYTRPDQFKHYNPIDTQDTEGNRYLFWKTKDQAAHVPELKDVRDEVVQTWKLVEARGKSLAEAKRLADQARPDARPLKEIFSDRSVIETKEFSWLTSNAFSPRAQPTLSPVEGVPDPGEEFLRTVTQLNVGETAVTQDYSRNTAYVARVTNTAYTPETFANLFLTSMRDYERYARAGEEVWREIERAWYEELKTEIGYKELRPLDQRGERAAELEPETL